ncbi:helix-turn-helix domain-containing protein [Halalkalibacter nanhaiisediminis]|uniref:Uncharacterized protein YpbB n=1 Tax=Halalkalibacter nanhaiisediminis TaxID=688079 RepID=A0A562QD07_9BACI|nr:helix-turn-helix domain-containing protein [Halalkalibacter nanhaiisediminis]TWI54614.1 uncharacterized protein YpbB [Halalkalibacter nanhaiisediminis]
MDTRQGVIATVLAAFKAERSIYGAYHLLKGKKSAQTIQDGSFFSILAYFGVLPTLSRAEIEKDIEVMISNQEAVCTYHDNILLTELGQEKLKQFHLERPLLRHLKGWQYHSYTETVWQRLCLYLQALSHLQAENHSFYPITHKTHIQVWVKQHLPRAHEDREQLLALLHDELVTFLSTCQNEQGLIFVHQLSGKGKIGLTRKQLAEQMNIDETDLYLSHIATLHQLFRIIENEPELYSVLSRFTEDMKKEFVLTESARQTFYMLKQGHTVQDISKRRKLKESTIEDHIVEIALVDPHFSLAPFVNKEIEQAILTLLEGLQTSRLRELKEKLPETVTYFMIRLVLARKKVDHGT